MIAELKNQNYLARPKPFLMASKRAEYIKEILASPYLQVQPLGQVLYGNLSPKAAQAKLANKLKGVQGRSLTEQEELTLISELQKLAVKILSEFPLDNSAPQPNDARKPEQTDNDWAKKILGQNRKEGS